MSSAIFGCRGRDPLGDPERLSRISKPPATANVAGAEIRQGILKDENLFSVNERSEVAGEEIRQGILKVIMDIASRLVAAGVAGEEIRQGILKGHEEQRGTGT